MRYDPFVPLSGGVVGVVVDVVVDGVVDVGQ